MAGQSNNRVARQGFCNRRGAAIPYAIRHQGDASMNQENPQDHCLTEAGVHEDLQRQPQLLMKLAENALTVAESLRDNYFKNTAKFVTALRRAMQQTMTGQRSDAILTVQSVENAEWSSVQGEVVTFID